MLELHTCVEASMSWNHILVLLLLNIWPFSLLMLLALELECQFTAIALSNKTKHHSLQSWTTSAASSST
jgi:hypothetical protein